MAFLGPFNAAVVNPSLVTLAKDFHKTTTVISYSTTVSIIMGGVSPFIFGPLTNVYGRRPVTLVCQLLAVLGNIGSAKSSTYSALLGTRALNGIGFGGMMSVGTACVSDMFFLHERGEKTGVYTIFVTNGAHIAAICGGFLSQHASWRWDFWLPSIITACSLLGAIFGFPETLFSRDPKFLSEQRKERSYWEMLFDPRGSMIPGRRLQLAEFFYSFRMLRYPSVILPVWWYTWCWTFANILPALTMSSIYTSIYHLKTGAIGVCLGVSLFIGSLLGEITAGKLSDHLLYILAKRHDGVPKPEHRLYLTTIAAFMMPVGVIVFGVCVERRMNYVIPLVGVAMSAYGLQMASTCLYAYVADCYKPQTAETGVLMNLSRGLSFCLAFFALPYGEKVGYDLAWMTFALMLWFFWFPILALMIWGERWRRILPTPEIHQYL
ncbi:hypothetical protein GYMLUDRAFT_40719 [Collybiopsis luxurians FD-317 M1]|uniref:Major facilitator superfamily (MFS) profile domain-containing protein n=1 Tax=Collybiopsis luxurians FD-317 M1 TaxID=944289 RepID=A0A0D0BI06_9AGAR|nr:hypothetical protein GYMLUDRAFT_40719 [Collybiopsis luxurians FD-317 M1]